MNRFQILLQIISGSNTASTIIAELFNLAQITRKKVLYISQPISSQFEDLSSLSFFWGNGCICQKSIPNSIFKYFWAPEQLQPLFGNGWILPKEQEKVTPFIQTTVVPNLRSLFVYYSQVIFCFESKINIKFC